MTTDKQWGHVPEAVLDEDEALAQSIDDDITETFLPEPPDLKNEE